MKIIRDPGAIVAALANKPDFEEVYKLYQEPKAKKKVDLLIVLVFILKVNIFKPCLILLRYITFLIKDIASPLF